MTSAKRIDAASRIIRASAPIVYRALVDPGARRIWLPPNGMTGRIERFDPRVGGGYRMVLTYEDPKGNAGKSSDNSDVVEAHFVEIVPNERIVESIDFQSDDSAFAGTMTMTWTLTSASGATEVRVTASNVPDGISAEAHQCAGVHPRSDLCKLSKIFRIPRN